MGFSQSDCLALFNKIVTNSTLKSGSGNFEMKFQIKTIDVDDEVAVDEILIQQNNKKFRYETSNLIIYQDDANMVTVQHDPKVVIINPATPQNIQNQQLAQMNLLRDSVLKKMEMQECTLEFGVIEPREGYRKIVFKPMGSFSALPISQVSYWLHEPTASVKRILIRYKPNNDFRVKDYELTIDKMNLEYKQLPFEGAAVAQVKLGNQVAAQFRGYKLVDNRVQ